MEFRSERARIIWCAHFIQRRHIELQIHYLVMRIFSDCLRVGALLLLICQSASQHVNPQERRELCSRTVFFFSQQCKCDATERIYTPRIFREMNSPSLNVYFFNCVCVGVTRSHVNLCIYQQITRCLRGLSFLNCCEIVHPDN
jgi:hypothetical protein